MRLTQHTDYALRLLMCLALAPDGSRTIQQVAEAYGISRSHLMKVAHRLGRAGLVEATRGRGGGLRLGRPATAITVGAVVRATEDDMALVACMEDGGACAILPACRLKAAFAEARDAFLTSLDGHTLADLVARPTALRRLLAVA